MPVPPAPPDLTVSVHLGAHKTATTYIQRSLEGARAELTARGVALVLPRDIRGRIGLQNPAARFSVAENDRRIAEGREKLDALFRRACAEAGAHRLVVSEETLIGSSRHNLSSQSLYDDIGLRLEVLPGWLNSPRTTFFFSTRAYPGFFASNATTAVRGRALFDAEKLRIGLTGPGRGWAEVVGDIRAAFPRAGLALWRYEDLARIEGRVMGALTGSAVAMYDGPRLTTTLSQAAMDWLHRKAETPAFRESPRKFIRRARARFSVGEGHPPYRLWAPESDEAQDLEAAYARDWQAIRARWPDAVIAPGAADSSER